MRIFFCGLWRHAFYEQACADALTSLGETVIPFKWGPYFARSVLGKLEERYTFAGPVARSMNRAMLAAARASKPDVILIWRGTHVLPGTLRKLRRDTGALVVSYVNDDPFAETYAGSRRLHMRRLWKYYLDGLPLSDLHLVYRPVNLDEARAAGARDVEILLPYFIPEIHRPVELTVADVEHYGADVSFIGHYEDDGREQKMRALMDAGVSLRVYGAYWPRPVLERLAQPELTAQPVLGVEYAKAVAASKLSLCFLSRLNRDVYTRRCFEIPACRGVLLSERTDALTTLFEDGREAVFFSSTEELIQRVLHLAKAPDELAAIAARGYARVWRDGHSVVDRMTQLRDLLSDKLAARKLTVR